MGSSKGPPSQLTDIWGPWGIQTGGAMTDWQKLPPYGGDSSLSTGNGTQKETVGDVVVMFFSDEQLKKGPWLLRVYIVDYTTQLYRDYKKPLWGSLLNNRDSMENKAGVTIGSAFHHREVESPHPTGVFMASGLCPVDMSASYRFWSHI